MGWDIFQSGFGHLTGLRKHEVMHVITKATLRGNHLLSGRQIEEKAKAVMLDAKKISCLLDGVSRQRFHAQRHE